MENIQQQSSPSPLRRLIGRQTKALGKAFGPSVPRQPTEYHPSRDARSGHPYRFVIMTYVVPTGGKAQGEYSVVHCVTFLRGRLGKKKWSPVFGYARHQPLHEVMGEAYKRLDHLPAPEVLDANPQQADLEVSEVAA